MVILPSLLKNFYKDAKEALYISDTQIGFRLKHLRERMKLSRSELARRAGIDRSSIIRYENNELIPKPQTIEKMLDALYADVMLFTNEGTAEEFIERCNLYYSELSENNIYKFRKEVEERLNNFFVYKHNQENVVISDKIMDFLKSNIMAAFEILDTLPHDREQS